MLFAGVVDRAIRAATGAAIVAGNQYGAGVNYGTIAHKRRAAAVCLIIGAVHYLGDPMGCCEIGYLRIETYGAAMDPRGAGILCGYRFQLRRIC
jgi:hypothetical protein